MRILFVSHRAHPSIGGIESHQWRVATGLAARHEVTVLAERIDSGATDRLDGNVRPLPSFAPFGQDGVEVRQLRLPLARRALLSPLALNVIPGTRRFAYGRMRVATAWLFARVSAPTLLRSAGARPDVIHVWGGDYLAASALRAGRAAGIPVIMTPFAHESQWGDDPASAAAYRGAQAVIGLLETDAALYERLGVSRDHIQICGVCAPGLRSGAGHLLKSQYGIEGPLVLFLGVRRPYKGFDRLLAAAPTIAAHAPDVTLAFVGPGPSVPSTRAGVRIIDAGPVNDELRAAWLDAADLMALPSDGEIFPVSILEAFSVGTPVLTSDIPPLREIIERSGGGVWTGRDPETLGAAIARALMDSARLREMGNAGRSFWQATYTVDAVVASHEAIYSTVGSRTQR